MVAEGWGGGRSGGGCSVARGVWGSQTLWNWVEVRLRSAVNPLNTTELFTLKW